jgi:hypothetical protein
MSNKLLSAADTSHMEPDSLRRARAQVADLLARWRSRLPAADVPTKARALAAAIRSDMAAGADPAQGEAMLAELARAL